MNTNPTNLDAPPATIDDLYRVEGKAELIDGRIVRYAASGLKPAEVSLNVAILLRDFATRTNVGKAYLGSLGYAIRPRLTNGRESFQPDASYYVGPLPTNRMRFIEGAPTFAVEVRSEEDYGPVAEREMAAKLADYFEAGTQVVWDVDPLARTIASYRASAPSQPTIFRSGDTADAESAVPEWRVAVDDVFGPAS